MNPGDLLGGRYRLARQVGNGGMSVVWLADDRVLQREVAVKVLSASLATDPELLRRIALEARAAARLSHPNIVEVYDFGEHRSFGKPSTPYVVMEFTAGRSLAHLLTAGALSWRVTSVVCAQVAAALAGAHAGGVVHRDVTPANVMITSQGVKLVDFGISAVVGDTDHGPDQQLIGTPAYIAPERLAEGFVNPATDVYALGLLLYRCIAGQLPWSTSTITQIMTNHRYVSPRPLPPIADVPTELAEICDRCLDKAPANRPTAAEVGRVLAELAGLPPGTLPLPGAMDAVLAAELRPADTVNTIPVIKRPADAAPGRRQENPPINPNGRASRAAANIAALLDGAN